MIKYFHYLYIFGIFISLKAEDKSKKKFAVSGIVQNVNGEGIKGVRLIIYNKDREEIDDGKSGKKGQFKFKKISAGSYILEGEHKKEGKGGIKFSVKTKDIDNIILKIKIPEEKNEIDNMTIQPPKESEKVLLPQQRNISEKETLKFEEYFFGYESNIKELKLEIDSLKSVVKGYEKKQTMPNVSREILDLIKVPDYQHRVELQNGTVVSGSIIEESDSTLTLSTQIGTLVLKKEMVIRMDELEKPGPKVIFLGDPFVDYYPDHQIFTGKVKNIGEIRADFVRVIGKLFDQATTNTGTDSIFVKGTRVVYESNVIADTALKPGQTASYSLTVPIKKGQKSEYHIMDIHWEQTK